ncbi:unnamed protein product [Prunus armeniaca]|uniref:Uncharacterized protein n=1 Tax=Prunus armeniaca TaxID=36596 RepID=A0A6J5XK03_PRUAR|nr:unnamed protein product [Prunus armeniaca]
MDALTSDSPIGLCGGVTLCSSQSQGFWFGSGSDWVLVFSFPPSLIQVVVPLDCIAFVRSRIFGVGHDFKRLGLMVVLTVPLSTGSIVLGLCDPSGDRNFTVVEQFIYIDEFAIKVMEANLEGFPNFPWCVCRNACGLGIR